MLARTPLKRKRDTPRRDEGRVSSVRIKPQRAVAPTATEKRHMDRLRAMGCLVCASHHVELHHVLSVPDKVRRRDHRYVAPLCRDHHQGQCGVHGLGSEAAFERAHGIDLAAFAVREWDNSCGAVEAF